VELLESPSKRLRNIQLDQVELKLQQVHHDSSFSWLKDDTAAVQHVRTGLMEYGNS
jgi:alanine racemase